MSRTSQFLLGKRKSENDLRRRSQLGLGLDAGSTRPQTSGKLARSDADELIPPVPRLSDAYRESSESDKSEPPRLQRSKSQRFSFLRLRNASDPQLFRSLANSSEDLIPPLPLAALSKTPSIITTSPTMDIAEPVLPAEPPPGPALTDPSNRKWSMRARLRSKKRSTSPRFEIGDSPRPNSLDSRHTFDNEQRPASLASYHPQLEEDSHLSGLHPPTPRFSESSRSTTSSSEPVAFATTTTTHTVSTTTTTFFRLPRRKKTQAPLFPLPAKVPAHESKISHAASKSVEGSLRSPEGETSPLPSPARSFTAGSSAAPSGPLASVLRNSSFISVQSNRSSQSLSGRAFHNRRRSSTFGSFHDITDDKSPLHSPLAPPRSSTSASRSSIGNLFSFTKGSRNSLDRLQRGSEPITPLAGTPLAGTPLSSTSKSNSLSISRDSIVVPEREDDDTPALYLEKLQGAVSRSLIAGIVSKGSDTFSQVVLRKFMRSLSFFGDPLDMAIRKMLMEVELPKETQQIDRVLQAFADRYHECNPGIFASVDQAYFIAFSLLILHTDVFNKNNKHKMQRHDYLKNTRTEDIFDEILESFYDNICYTPFIKVEDEYDINGEKIVPHKSRKTFSFKATSDVPRRIKDPVDPYNLILEGDLDVLRPSLREVMNLENTYNYLGSATALDIPSIHRSFFKTGVLQIVSARSRPDAFMSPTTISNPIEAQPGVVDIKVTKVGILWRKDGKRKKTRSPWQEWGAILTGSQLYFFKNVGWVKNLIHQYEFHKRSCESSDSVVFKPPLEQFKADALMSTDDAVAIVDSSYKKHKHAFTFVRHDGLEEKFLADSEEDMNDWLSKLNYAATFRTAGVRMRALAIITDVRTSNFSEADGDKAEGSAAPTASDATAAHKKRTDEDLARQIMATRRSIMHQKIMEAEEKLVHVKKDLEVQLRNSRHLQIMTPILPKTRDHVINTAARFAAKLKWTRLDIIKLQCHRDILALDLDDEKPGTSERRTRLSVTTIESSHQSLYDREKMPSTKYSAKRASQGSILSITPSAVSAASVVSAATIRPGSSSSTDRDHEQERTMDDIFRERDISSPLSAEPDHLPSSESFLKPTDTPHGAFRMFSSMSSRSNVSTQSVPLTGSSSAVSLDERSDLARLVTGTPDLTSEESELLKRTGVLDNEEVLDDSTSNVVQPHVLQSKERSVSAGNLGVGVGLPKPKARRSLHRTIREAHLPSHHRSKRMKESSSNSTLSLDAGTSEKEGLHRITGSFTVHGKKASVVTFGNEWQNGDAEERIRSQRPSRSKGAGVMNDDESAISEVDSVSSVQRYRRRESAASTAASTTRSIRRDMSKDREMERSLASSDAQKLERPRTPLGPISDNEVKASPRLSVVDDAED